MTFGKNLLGIAQHFCGSHLVQTNPLNWFWPEISVCQELCRGFDTSTGSTCPFGHLSGGFRWMWKIIWTKSKLEMQYSALNIPASVDGWLMIAGTELCIFQLWLRWAGIKLEYLPTRRNCVESGHHVLHFI